MDRPVQIVRLIGVVLMSLAATLFVHVYSQALSIRMVVEYHTTDVPRACNFLVDYGWAGIVLPVLATVLGVLAIVKQRRVLHEIVLVLVSVLTVAWVLGTIIAWQCAQIPTFSGMQLHY